MCVVFATITSRAYQELVWTFIWAIVILMVMDRESFFKEDIDGETVFP